MHNWSPLCIKSHVVITFLVVILNNLTISPLASQNYMGQPELRFNRFSVENGLSNDDVTSIVQDKYGFIWIGTADGLNRFDGENIRIFRHDHTDTNSLSNNVINALYIDSNNDLWVATNQLLCKYDYKHDRFIRIKSNPLNGQLHGEWIVRLVELNKTLWILIAGEGISSYDLNSGALNIYRIHDQNPEKESFNTFGPIIAGQGDKLWIGSRSGLTVYDSKDNKVENYKFYTEQTGLADRNLVASITRVQDNQYWVGTWNNGIFVLDDNANQLSHFPASITGNQVKIILKDSGGRVWVGTQHNLLIYPPGEDSFYRYHYNKSDHYSFSIPDVQMIVEDRQGNIWIGHKGLGLSVLINSKKFNTLSFEKPELPTRRTVSALLKDSRENLWIGYFSGELETYSMKTGQHTVLPYSAYNQTHHSPGTIFSFLEDADGTIWVGSYKGGLVGINPATGRYVQYLHNPNDMQSIGKSDVRQIIDDGRGNLWMALAGAGVNKMNKATGIFTRYTFKRGDTTTLSDNWTYSLIKDKTTGDIWISTSTGISRINALTDKITRYYASVQELTGLSNNNSKVIFQDSKNRIWIGTHYGLNLFKPSENNFKNYFQQDGLVGNNIRSITEDAVGNLWIGTTQGLSRLNPETGEFRNYDTKDGLPGNIFSPRTTYNCQLTDHLFFGTNTGILYFNPSEIEDNPYIPPIVITQFSIYNQPIKPGKPYQGRMVLDRSVTEAESIHLSYSDKIFSFEFAALQYNTPEKNRYKYILKPFDSYWNDVGISNRATYTNIPPGRYTFTVIGSNNDGVFNTEGRTIRIIITPPFWQTWWFRGLAIIFAVGSLTGLYFFRVYSLRKRQRFLEQLVKERTREIEDKNRILLEQADELNEINAVLEERQQYIEEQAEELRSQAEELNEKNIDLNYLNATKDKFFSIIAHDLKNPFGNILGFSELISMKYHRLDDEKRLQYISAIYESAQLIFKLLENLLQWARAQTGAIRFAPEQIIISELVNENLTLLESSLTEKGIKTIKNLDPEAQIFADRNMLSTVLRNILSNSVKYTEKGTITITVESTDNDLWRISITDTGKGMPLNKTNNLFNIDQVKSTSGTRGEKGTGLGLVICKEFIDKHKGSIRITSEENVGTTIEILLPR